MLRVVHIGPWSSSIAFSKNLSCLLSLVSESINATPPPDRPCELSTQQSTLENRCPGSAYKNFNLKFMYLSMIHIFEL
ncbi:uncharacterized protein HD556DRAFT_1359586 [Suillus plorans]|uniref:Uncharacterized protein n=1 Tax=Suillus plorans TaxID=116603 RepID=A0A9P7IWA0_9AGAM|nr:uncharacterized protein HD556DRAFT_1359586 [Suillus plorans]KAG1796749.1 hypothetical protein HD556DRAFT_1359586 [Suillus plorans]